MMNILLLSLLGSLTLTNAQQPVPAINGVSPGSASISPASMLDSQDPIWYNRMPTFDQDDIQKTNYLYCKMAHSGRDQWTEATPSSVASVDSAPSSGNPGSSQKQCRKCFCLPNTQRIGCVKISCSESPASPNGKMPAPPAQLRKRSQVLVPHSSRSKGSVKAVEDGRLRMRSNAGGSRFPPVPQNPRYK